MSKHDFLYPYIVTYDTESSLPVVVNQPAVKRAKMCEDLNGDCVACVLKFSTTHQLLSYSIATNAPGCDGEFFACRAGDTATDVAALVQKFVSQLLNISKQSFDYLLIVYSDVLLQLDHALSDERANNATSGLT